MTVAALINRCRAAGVTLRVAEGAIDYDAPDTPAADALLAEVAAQRRAALRYLAPWLPPTSARDIFDPRPDLVDDSRRWQILLRLAWVEDGDEPTNAYAALDFIRRCGAMLVRDGGHYRIRPRLSAPKAITADDGTPLELADETAWATADEWGRDKEQLLEPHRLIIPRLLRHLADVETPITDRRAA